ncbi:MAG: penicillin-binding protein [Rhodospirillaceae bacterium TMED167]|nr:penicillin-binding protein [Rhodospirillaceae bacterium]OUW30878.1 MAG: penicillin-binding protein [Rhodospirillaceae bacterium TMED167]
MLKTFLFFVSTLMILAIVGAAGGMYVFYIFGRGLPDYRQLADYEPPVMTRVQAGDGRLLVEYAIQKRVFVPGSALPKLVVQAMLSAEDKNFYYHPGVDFTGVARAMLTNVQNIATDRRLVGASTITQQVAKNFLLTSDVTMERKLKEAILAFRIERALSKDRILELYLNEIYLGFGSYGVAAAALNYFNKSLDRLTIAEAAFIAALPKAPNNYNPNKRPEAAKRRRDWVIGRMLEDEIITRAQAQDAKAQPLIIRKRDETEYVQAKYYAEEVRRELVAHYGEEELYKGGLSVRTTLSPHHQRIAVQALQNGLEAYDRRHGWRGPINTISVSRGWLDALTSTKPPKGLGAWQLAVVLGATAARAEIGLSDGSLGTILLADVKWARQWLEGEKLGPQIKSATDVLQAGDVIAVEKITNGDDNPLLADGRYTLRQIPKVEGALIAMDPHTGRVLAMVGGYDYDKSQFNRAVQARRQPGSAFKPFVYLAALDQGFTPSTLILDAPFVIDQGPGLPKWRPANYTKKFYGPSTMRLGIEKSRNLMTVRLAQTVGIETITQYAKKFGIAKKLPPQLSISLGAGETTLLNLTTAYGMLVNGGKRIRPALIDRVQDRHGKTVFKHDTRACSNCQPDFWTDQSVPTVPDTRDVVTKPSSAFQIVSMLEGAVERGTGRRIKAVGKPLAGKTGTTNDAFDTWFMGFSPDLVVGVFVGFDTPRSLGKREQGASVAAPIFKEFMAEALADKPAIPFRIPPDIRLVRVNSATGQPATPGDRRVILEAFKPGTIPIGRQQVLSGVGASDPAGPAPTSGTGGLY